MSKEYSFLEIIDHMCKRPSMYVIHADYGKVAALIFGYSIGLEDSPIGSNTFNSFICKKFKFPTNYVWSAVIDMSGGTDTEKIEHLRKSIHEFVELKEKSLSEDVILDIAAEYKFKIEPLDSEAESIFRTFSKALLTGDKEILESLIIPHEKEHILWKGSYPEDVAAKLDQIKSEQPIRMTGKSEDGKTISILTSGWPFEIEMKMIGENWKVNASDIISMWDRNA